MLIYSFVISTDMEYLLCASYWTSCWDTTVNRTDKMQLYSLQSTGEYKHPTNNCDKDSTESQCSQLSIGSYDICIWIRNGHSYFLRKWWYLKRVGVGVGMGGGVPGRKTCMWEYFDARRSIVHLRSPKRTSVAEMCWRLTSPGYRRP